MPRVARVLPAELLLSVASLLLRAAVLVQVVPRAVALQPVVLVAALGVVRLRLPTAR
jgi:hypothetical protein